MGQPVFNVILLYLQGKKIRNLMQKPTFVNSNSISEGLMETYG
jgi:hypothetical protein